MVMDLMVHQVGREGRGIQLKFEFLQLEQKIVWLNNRRRCLVCKKNRSLFDIDKNDTNHKMGNPYNIRYFHGPPFLPETGFFVPKIYMPLCRWIFRLLNLKKKKSNTRKSPRQRTEEIRPRFTLLWSWGCLIQNIKGTEKARGHNQRYQLIIKLKSHKNI